MTEAILWLIIICSLGVSRKFTTTPPNHQYYFDSLGTLYFLRKLYISLIFAVIRLKLNGLVLRV